MKFLSLSVLLVSTWWISGCGPASLADSQASDASTVNAEEVPLKNPYCTCVKAPCDCPMFKIAKVEPVSMNEAPTLLPVAIKPPMMCVCKSLPCNCSMDKEPTEKMGNLLSSSMKMAIPQCSSVTGCQKPCMPFDTDCWKGKSVEQVKAIANEDESFGDALEGTKPPMKLECADGRNYKLAAGAPAPAGCAWVPLQSSATMNADENDSFSDALESIKPPMKLECADGRNYKLAAGAPAPAGCAWVPLQSSTTMNADEAGLSLPDSISSGVMRPKTCMCIKAPCNCPTPPAPTKEVEELY